MGARAPKGAPGHSPLKTSNAISETSAADLRYNDSLCGISTMSKPSQRGIVRFVLGSMRLAR